jgi:Fe2+ transport system protein B
MFLTMAIFDDSWSAYNVYVLALVVVLYMACYVAIGLGA